LYSTFNQRYDLTEISSADVALTAYDALKEDLSHDSGREMEIAIS
jgi:hypothetical protein